MILFFPTLICPEWEEPYMTNSRPIFLVDDDADDLEMLQEVFADLDPAVSVLSVSSGKHAADILLRHSTEQLPGLIIVDFNMPDVTGAELLALLCKDARFNCIPKVVWSTSDASLYETICKQSGATHYFKKPDTIEGVESLARQLLLLRI